MNNLDIKEHDIKIETEGMAYGYLHTYENLTINNNSRKIHVLLPRDYESSNEKYPVIYFNDGHTVFYSGGLSPWSWCVDKTLEELLNKHKIRKVIVVAIHPINRADEYLNIKTITGDERKTTISKGQVNIYADYVVNQLKPFIESKYRVNANPDLTSIVGSSFGGIAALYISSKYCDKIGIGCVMSPSLNIAFNLYKDTRIDKSGFYRELKTFLRPNKKPNLWIDWGAFEPPLPKIAPEFIKYLKRDFNYQENKDLFFFEDPIGTHDERAWEYRFGLFASLFYKK